MTKNKYVDFSKTGLPNEVVAKMIQDVAFANGIYWWDSQRSYKPNANNIGLDPNNTLSGGWANNSAVPLSEFLAYLIERGSKPLEPAKPKSWLDDVVGKQIMAWDGDENPGEQGTNWVAHSTVEILIKENNGLRINGTFWYHVALLTGHEYRAFLPYNQWVDHRDEV